MKKLLCILLAVVLCFGICPVSAFADGEDIVVSATPSKDVVSVGDKFNVDFNLTKNSGFVTLGLQIEYDSDVLEIVCPNHKAGSNCADVVTNKLGAQGSVGNIGENSQYHTANPYIIQWAYGTLKNDVTYTGKIATLTFKAKKPAKNCKSTIKVTVDQASNYADKKITFVGGSTTVEVHNARTYLTKASLSANGSIVNKCEDCNKEISKTTIYYPKTVTLSATSYTYDGKVKTPTVAVKGSDGKVIPSTNYSVSYSSGRTNVGTYKVTVNFKNNYVGTKVFSFKINAASASKFSVKLAATSYTYDGKVKNPTVTVKHTAGKTLKNGTDYTLTYATGRKNVGTYKVTVKFKGNYTGTKTASFVINPPKTSLTSVAAGSKRFTAKWTKKASTQVTGYEIQYATSSSFKSAKTVNVTSNKTTSKLVKSLKGNTRYYVRVRTYKTSGKTKYYSSWSTAKKVTTKK